jgi:hypothetical protein
MADKKLNIKVSTTGASKSQKNLKGLSGSIKTLGKAALATGAAYFATRGLINGFSSALRLAGEQEQAEKKLEVALGKTSTALLKHASALQKMTTFGDEAIIGVQSSLAAFIKDEEQIKKATEATLDMAVAMGMDLKAAGDLVAKTLGSSTNAMSRYGIQVEGAVGSTERLESLTKNVSTLFGGQASAQADTYAGSVEQMKNSLGDMAEQIGAIMIPVFEKLEPHLSLAIDFWSKYFGSLKDGDTTSSDFSIQVQELNKQIKEQASLVDYIGGESYRTFVMIRKRANAEGREFAEQLSIDNELYKEATDKLDALNKEKQKQLDIEKALNTQAVVGLELRRAEIDMDIEYVEVIDPATKGNSLFAASFHDIAGASSTALSQTSDLLAATSGASKRQQVQAMRLAQFAAIADTASGVMKAFKQGGTLGFITGAGIAATGAAQVATIQQAISNAQGAETGFDGIVNRPTMFMTGEGNKAERVSVTPLQGPNINGPQGGITLNISAPLVDETVIDSIIPAIQKAQRMNLA